MSPQVETFYHDLSSTFSYVVHAGPGSPCAVIDPVLGFDPVSGRTDTAHADQIADFVRGQNLKAEWLLETHIHADHLSAAHYLKNILGGTAKVAASDAIKFPCRIFSSMFNIGDTDILNAGFDHLFSDSEVFYIGQLKARALQVPGHTPADLAYQIEEKTVFVGDTLFAPDLGTARCDFPGGSAEQLFRSVSRLLRLPGDTLLYLCHDYPDNNRGYRNVFTVAQQLAENIHVKTGTTEADFVAMRRIRDASLSLPRLMVPAIQVNIRGGRLPQAEQNGVSYLKIPLNTL